MSSLSLISPCRNEPGSIRRFVEDWHQELSKKLSDFEMVIVNDCSTDATPAILDELAARLPHLVVLHNERNLRYGGTIFRGFHHSQKEFVFWTDSDYSHYPSDFWKLWEHREQHDAVWGVRTLTSRDNRERICYTVGNVLVIAALFGELFRDPNCAFKLYRRETLLSIINTIRPHAILTTTKIALKSRQRRLAVKEIPVVFLKRSEGTVPFRGFRYVPVVFSCVKELLKLRISGQ